MLSQIILNRNSYTTIEKLKNLRYPLPPNIFEDTPSIFEGSRSINENRSLVRHILWNDFDNKRDYYGCNPRDNCQGMIETYGKAAVMRFCKRERFNFVFVGHSHSEEESGFRKTDLLDKDNKHFFIFVTTSSRYFVLSNVFQTVMRGSNHQQKERFKALEGNKEKIEREVLSGLNGDVALIDREFRVTGQDSKEFGLTKTNKLCQELLADSLKIKDDLNAKIHETDQATSFKTAALAYLEAQQLFVRVLATEFNAISIKYSCDSDNAQKRDIAQENMNRAIEIDEVCVELREKFLDMEKLLDQARRTKKWHVLDRGK